MGAAPWSQTPVPHQDKGTGRRGEGPGAQGGGAACAALLRHHLTHGCWKIPGIHSPALHIPYFSPNFPFCCSFPAQGPAAGRLARGHPQHSQQVHPSAERGSSEVWNWQLLQPPHQAGTAPREIPRGVSALTCSWPRTQISTEPSIWYFNLFLASKFQLDWHSPWQNNNLKEIPYKHFGVGRDAEGSKTKCTLNLPLEMEGDWGFTRSCVLEFTYRGIQRENAQGDFWAGCIFRTGCSGANICI